MVLVWMYGQNNIDTMALGLMVKCKGRERWIFKMGVSMTDSGQKVKEMERE